MRTLPVFESTWLSPSGTVICLHFRPHGYERPRGIGFHQWYMPRVSPHWGTPTDAGFSFQPSDYLGPLNQPIPEGMLATWEVAARPKIEPRHLRVVLRSVGKSTGGERYMWKEGSPELAKIAEAVKEHQAKLAKKK